MSDGRRLFGVETEYAVAAVDTNGVVLPTLELGGALLRAAERTLPSLHGAGESGLYLGNGSRLYVDAGAHPELAGPECLDPWSAVRYLEAGHRLMLRLGDEVRRRNPILADARIFIGNVDYGETGSTWGSHESYCHRSTPDLLRRRLVPHLVSRVIYCGAGGFNPLSPGLEFMLSPRASHLNHVTSAESTHDRGITHTRQEPLAGHGYHRQHLLCGESLRSHTASWLRIGTTALVVAMIDGGIVGGDEVALASPVEALRAVAADPACSMGLRLARGGTATAIELQRYYLELARASLHDPVMPRWAGEVCTAWEDVLERLASGPDRVSTTLDWAIKQAIYRDRTRRQGFDWTSLPVWSRALAGVDQARRRGEGPFPPITPALLESDECARTGAAVQAPTLEAAGCRWDQLDAFLALRRELLELDMRWGLLGSGGLFDPLERAGVLDHLVAGVEPIDEAIEQPPAGGRAHVRGTVIRRVSREPGHYACGWNYVSDLRTGSLLDLSDPFVEVEAWQTRAERKDAVRKDAGSPPPDAGHGPHPPADEASLLDEIRRAFSRIRTGTRGTRSTGSTEGER